MANYGLSSLDEKQLNKDENRNELTLSTPVTELEERLLNEDNPENIGNIVELFNLNMQKKELIRKSKLNDVQDKICDEITARVANKPGEFSNKDILDYLKIINDVTNKSNNQTELTVPSIQINQQVNNNINADQFDRESRAKILNAVQDILNNIDNAEVIDVEESEVVDD